MNKQIEEISQIISAFYDRAEMTGSELNTDETATNLYNAGYRKQSENTVEVVRCKDCKYFKMAGTTPRCNFYKGLATTVNPQTDYCSYGEPKMKGGAE